jgi:hypothetical protein
MSAKFYISQAEDDQYTWRLVGEVENVETDKDTPGPVLATGRSFPTRGEARTDIGAFCRDVADAGVFVESKLPGDSRWRSVGDDGVAGDRVPNETPDYDEGETGPPEVQG